MNRIILACLLTTVSAPVMAHPGDHHDFSGWSGTLQHFVESPFHAALLAGSLAVGFGLFKLVRNLKRHKAR